MTLQNIRDDARFGGIRFETVPAMPEEHLDLKYRLLGTPQILPRNEVHDYIQNGAINLTTGKSGLYFVFEVTACPGEMVSLGNGERGGSVFGGTAGETKMVVLEHASRPTTAGVRSIECTGELRRGENGENLNLVNPFRFAIII